MSLLRLLFRLGWRPFYRLFASATISALCTTLVLFVVSKAAQEISNSKADFVDMPLLILFLLSIAAYIRAESWMVAHLSADMERAIGQLRMRLVELIRHADLRKLECFGESSLYETIAQNCAAISSNSQFLAQAVRSVVLALLILCYVATISLTAALLIALFLAVGALLHRRLGQELETRQQRLRHQETCLFERVADLFEGFKEQKISRRHSVALNCAFAETSHRTAALRGDVHQLGWQQFVLGETAFNVMLGLAVFTLPRYAPAVSGEVLKISAAVTFLSVPVFGLMQSLAIMRATEEAARRMIALEGELVALAEAESSAGQSLPRDFGQLEMRGIAYAFPARQGERGFTIGPLNIRLERGEVVFVTGGNGAGKSTFLKLLTHLYSPRQGEILVDGQTVDLARLAAYRDLIAPVFSDFHLFERLYGLGQDAWRAAEPLLDMMEMTRHVRVEQGRFSKLDLSTGQRKRLALVAALLENRPVLVLDEWAADQDPHFRRKFYRELIPWLRRDGKTIVAVTHDDHYFDAADRLWHLEEGQLTELPPPRKDA